MDSTACSSSLGNSDIPLQKEIVALFFNSVRASSCLGNSCLFQMLSDRVDGRQWPAIMFQELGSGESGARVGGLCGQAGRWT